MGRRGRGAGRTPKKLVALAPPGVGPGEGTVGECSPEAESPWQQPLRVLPGAGIVWTPETPQGGWRHAAGGNVLGYSAFAAAAGDSPADDEGAAGDVPAGDAYGEPPYEDAFSEYGNTTDEGSPEQQEVCDKEVAKPKAGLSQPLLEDGDGEEGVAAENVGTRGAWMAWCACADARAGLLSLFTRR